jgi:hypothetical protein
LIVIVGDSWGVGEWGNDAAGLTGPGIGQLLSISHTVANFSKGGASNSTSLKILSEFLKRYTPRLDGGKYDDVFYWIVSDPTRCISLEEIVNHQTTIEKQLISVLDSTFQQADAIAKENNLTINVIGGICDLNPEWVNPYTNLKLAVPSWGSLIYENYPTSIYDIRRWEEVGEHVKKYRPLLLNEWTQIAELAAKKYDIWKDKGHHPDRYDHRTLRNYLYPTLSSLY